LESEACSPDWNVACLVMLTMLQMESKLDKGDDPSLNDKHMVLGDIVSRDTKA